MHCEECLKQAVLVFARDTPYGFEVVGYCEQHSPVPADISPYEVDDYD